MFVSDKSVSLIGLGLGSATEKTMDSLNLEGPLANISIQPLSEIAIWLQPESPEANR